LREDSDVVASDRFEVTTLPIYHRGLEVDHAAEVEMVEV
jgi:hypothetical protein